MATYKHLRSSTANKRPTTAIADGQLALNTNTASPGLFFKDSAGTGIVKIGPVHVGTTAPNSTPAAGGSSGNYTGEQWLDTSVSPAQLKVWNGSAWVGVVADELPVSKLQDGEAGQIVQTDSAGTGVEWSSTANLPLGTASAPAYRFQGDANSGLYSPGADQVAISTGGTQRLLIEADGDINIDSGGVFYDAANNRLAIGTTSPVQLLHVQSPNNTAETIAGFGNQSIGTGLQVTTNGNLDWGFNAVNTRNITFSTNQLERARIDSSGRLLVGTSTAFSVRIATTAITHRQQLYGGNGADSSFVQGCGSTTDSTAAFHWFAKFASGTVNDNTTTVVSGEQLGTITWSGSDGTNQTQAAHIRCEVDGTPGANDMPGRLVFSVTADGESSPTERVRITSSGYLKASNYGAYINAAQSYHELRSNQPSTSTVLVENSSATGYGIEARLSSDGTSYAYFVGYSTSASANRIVIWSNGNVVNTNNSYGSISDAKLKENIVDANSQWDDLKALQVRNYNFKEGQTHTQIGLIAQEAELVSPGLVTESPDRDEDGNDLGTVTKSVNYSVLYMKAVKALQEAMERIEVLEAKVNALEGN